MKTILKILTVIVLANPVFNAKCASTGNYNMNWNTTAGGGGTSAAGRFSLTATVGQADTGVNTGGTSTLISGFWATDGIVLPTLRIARAGSDAQLSWPIWAPDFVLQSRVNIAGNTPWVLVTQSPLRTGDEFLVRVSATKAKEFFRLVKP